MIYSASFLKSGPVSSFLVSVFDGIFSGFWCPAKRSTRTQKTMNHHVKKCLQPQNWELLHHHNEDERLQWNLKHVATGCRYLGRNATHFCVTTLTDAERWRKQNLTKQVHIYYLCNSVNNILVVILDGNDSLTFKHPEISDNFSFKTFQRKPEEKLFQTLTIMIAESAEKY